VVRKRRLNALGLVPDNDRRRGWGQRGCLGEDVLDDPRPGDPVEHFRHGGFHARAFAGGKNNEMNVHLRRATLWFDTVRSQEEGGKMFIARSDEVD
jgi:hypothetical protein